MRQQFRLVIQLATRHRAVDAIEIACKLQMLQDAAREHRPLRRCQIDPRSGLLHRFKRIANSRIELASEQAYFAVMLTIGQYRLADPVVSIRLQQKLQHVFERRPNNTLDVVDFTRFMSKGAQRRHAACQNAGLGIDQGAVEIEKNGASRGHGTSIAAGGRRVNVRLNLRPLRII